MRKLVLALVMTFSLSGVATVKAADLDPENTLYMDLTYGRVVIQMYPGFAPKHVERIKTLTREGFYDGLTFHRVMEGFMVQGGDPNGNGTGGSKYPDLEDEFNIKRHWRGVASMANSGIPNSANSQFFIMLADNRGLDGKYTIWGRVKKGMKYIDKIKKGDPYDNGKVTGPDKIVRMRVMADVEPAAEPDPAAEATEATENTETVSDATTAETEYEN